MCRVDRIYIIGRFGEKRNNGVGYLVSWRIIFRLDLELERCHRRRERGLRGQLMLWPIARRRD